MGKQSRRKKTKDRKERIEQHHREGKLLHPPIHALKNLKPASWVHTRLPDQIWVALLLTQLERTLGLEILRTVAKACQNEFKPGQDLDLTLSGIAAMPADLASRIIELVTLDRSSRGALEPLLLFEDFPGRDRWTHHLEPTARPEAWDILADTVARVLFHQSQEATDTRWARVLFKVAVGQMRLRTEETWRWLANYPIEGDQKMVRPFIRANEIIEHPEHDYTVRDEWAVSFWSQCLQKTPCANYLKPALRNPPAYTTRTHVAKAMEEITLAAYATSRTSGIDARHSAGFGMVTYALHILGELLGIGVAQGILGRLGLRAVFETYATYSYLTVKDDPELWASYRAYGQGQAKLAMLKLDEFIDPPSFATAELLEELASEDKASMFVSVNLGHWANMDLRKLSETAGIKDSYDRLYPWTSAFVHGNWASVRAASTALCGNPLHRLHAVIQPSGNSLDDVLGDVCELIDEMFILLGTLYSVKISPVSIKAEA